MRGTLLVFLSDVWKILRGFKRIIKVFPVVPATISPLKRVYKQSKLYVFADFLGLFL